MRVRPFPNGPTTETRFGGDEEDRGGVRPVSHYMHVKQASRFFTGGQRSAEVLYAVSLCFRLARFETEPHVCRIVPRRCSRLQGLQVENT